MPRLNIMAYLSQMSRCAVYWHICYKYQEASSLYMSHKSCNHICGIQQQRPATMITVKMMLTQIPIFV